MGGGVARICKSIFTKIRSIAQNSHTHPPEIDKNGCNKKDVILSKPMKQGDFWKKLVFGGGVVAKTACFFEDPIWNF